MSRCRRFSCFCVFYKPVIPMAFRSCLCQCLSNPPCFGAVKYFSFPALQIGIMRRESLQVVRHHVDVLSALAELSAPITTRAQNAGLLPLKAYACLVECELLLHRGGFSDVTARWAFGILSHCSWSATMDTVLPCVSLLPGLAHHYYRMGDILERVVRARFAVECEDECKLLEVAKWLTSHVQVLRALEAAAVCMMNCFVASARLLVSLVCSPIRSLSVILAGSMSALPFLLTHTHRFVAPL